MLQYSCTSLSFTNTYSLCARVHESSYKCCLLHTCTLTGTCTLVTSLCLALQQEHLNTVRLQMWRVCAYVHPYSLLLCYVSMCVLRTYPYNYTVCTSVVIAYNNTISLLHIWILTRVATAARDLWAIGLNASHFKGFRSIWVVNGLHVGEIPYACMYVRRTIIMLPPINARQGDHVDTPR